MTTNNIDQVNPNYLFGCHPLGSKERFQELDRQEIEIFRTETVSISEPENCFGGGRRQSVLDIFRRIAKVDSPAKGHLSEFLYQKYRQNCKQRTLSNYCTSIGFLLTFAAKRGRTQIEQLTRDDLEAFIEHEQDRGMKPKTLNLRLMCIYSFIRYLVENDQLPPDRFTRKIKIKVPDALPRAMDPIDVHRLLRIINGVRDRAMVLVMLRTGIRIGELLNLKVNDVHLSERKILIWKGEKNRIGRVVCLSDDAHRALSEWFYIRDPQKNYIFYSRHRKTMGYTTARQMFLNYLVKAGLSDKNYSLHSLRHTFATDLLNAGMRIECLQQLLGHSSLEMTLRYARLTDRTREEEYFKAMAVIEGEYNNESNRVDCTVPASPKTAQLLDAYDQNLPQ
jgi:site-specific recombinase XerD